MRLRMALLGAVMMLGCGSDASSSPADTSGSGTGEEGAEGSTETGADPMLCPETYESMEPNGELPPAFVDCELPSPCNEVIYEMVGQGGTDGGDENQNPAALSCVLDALASGEPGRFNLRGENSTTTIQVEIRVYAGGRAEWSYDEVEDSAWTQSRTASQIVPEYFTNNVCNATTTWAGGWNCIRDGLAVCETWADAASLCPQ